MTTEEARRNLEEADRYLRSVIDGLVDWQSRSVEVSRELKQAVQHLELVRKEFQPDFGTSLLPYLHQIRARSARAQVLLDSAATFYCGAIAAAGPRWSFYTPAGEVSGRDAGVRLNFEG